MGGSHPKGCLDIVSVVKVTGDMVVTFSFNAFTRNELLAGRLAGRVAGRNATSARKSSIGSALSLSRSLFM